MPAHTGRDRQFAAAASAILGVIFLCLLGIFITILRWDLLWILTLWFLLLLALSHLVFFWRTSTTARQVKLIDYPYLLIGAFSIWLAVASGQKERAIYVKELDEMTAPATVNGLRSLLNSSREKFCEASTDYKPENYCEWTLGVSHFLSEPFTLSQLQQAINDTENTVPTYIIRDQGHLLGFYFTSLSGLEHLTHIVNLNPFGWVSLLQNWDNEPITIQPVANLTYAAIITSEPSRTPGTSEVSVTTLGSIAIGLGKVVLWPFVLAIAVALRITKVTADVTGWAG
jgi:hypothetical protein